MAPRKTTATSPKPRTAGQIQLRRQQDLKRRRISDVQIRNGRAQERHEEARVRRPPFRPDVQLDPSQVKFIGSSRSPESLERKRANRIRRPRPVSS